MFDIYGSLSQWLYSHPSKDLLDSNSDYVNARKAVGNVWAYRFALILVVFATAGLGGYQAWRNSKDQNKTRQTLEAENKITQAKLETLSFLLTHLPPTLTSQQVSEIVKGYTKPIVQPLPGTMTNAELRNHAEKLIARIKQLDVDKAKAEADFMAYWSANPLPPDSVNRDRRKEIDGIQENIKFQFRYSMLQEYVYLFQEIINRIPAKTLQKAGYGEKDGLKTAWLAVGGLFDQNIDYTNTAQSLQNLLVLLPK